MTQSQSQDKPQAGQSQSQGLPGSALSGASVDKPSGVDGVGRQSGQQREHGHHSAEDQARDGAGAAHAKQGGDSGGKSVDGTDAVGGHPEASPEGVSRGTNGGVERDDIKG